MRHSWSRKTKNRTIDSSSTSCLKCGIIRQFIKGIATYYNPETDIVIDRKAPKCKPKLINL
jgi:hypothetical protein